MHGSVAEVLRDANSLSAYTPPTLSAVFDSGEERGSSKSQDDNDRRYLAKVPSPRSLNFGAASRDSDPIGISVPIRFNPLVRWKRDRGIAMKEIPRC
jgi:hypothetical protein